MYLKIYCPYNSVAVVNSSHMMFPKQIKTLKTKGNYFVTNITSSKTIHGIRNLSDFTKACRLYFVQAHCTSHCLGSSRKLGATLLRQSQQK